MTTPTEAEAVALLRRACRAIVALRWAVLNAEYVKFDLGAGDWWTTLLIDGSSDAEQVLADVIPFLNAAKTTKKEGADHGR